MYFYQWGMNQETYTGKDAYCREAIAYENIQANTMPMIIELRDTTAYLESLDLKEFKLVLNASHAADVFHGIKFRILNHSGYWGSHGQDVVIFPLRNVLGGEDNLTRDFNHVLRLIDCQTMRPTEKVQPIKIEILDMNDRPINRDFVYLRFTACFGKNYIRHLDQDRFQAQ